MGVWPATVFLAFIGLELVYPTSSDRDMVAMAGVIYNGLMVWGIANVRLWRTPIRLTGASGIKIG